MWRKSKVIYEGRVNRDTKTITEHYLHDSISLGDVEHQCAELLKKRITTGIEMVDSAAKVKFAQVIFFGMQEDDHFYEIKLAEWTDGKKSTYAYLLPAISPEQAIERMTAYMGTSQSDWRMIDIKESDILAVWNASSELWTGDWWNRMDRYYDEGKRMFDANEVTDGDEDDEDDSQTELDIVKEFRTKAPGEEVAGFPKSKKGNSSRKPWNNRNNG